MWRLSFSVRSTPRIVARGFEHLSTSGFFHLDARVYPDMYASAVGQSPLIDTLFLQLRKKVKQELLLQRELVSLRGALSMILTASTLGSAPITQNVPAAGA